eukprot:1047121-Pelagomonas_calceolata.AAC.1
MRAALDGIRSTDERHLTFRSIFPCTHAPAGSFPRCPCGSPIATKSSPPGIAEAREGALWVCALTLMLTKQALPPLPVPLTGNANGPAFRCLCTSLLEGCGCGPTSSSSARLFSAFLASFSFTSTSAGTARRGVARSLRWRCSQATGALMWAEGAAGVLQHLLAGSEDVVFVNVCDTMGDQEFRQPRGNLSRTKLSNCMILRRLPGTKT